MKIMIKSSNSLGSTRGNSAEDKMRRELYTPEYYPDVDPQRIEDLLRIKWKGVTAEDSECILYDNMDLSNVKSISYLNDSDVTKAQDLGYEGGYVFKYNDGTKKKFAWMPYPNNLDPMEEIHI